MWPEIIIDIELIYWNLYQFDISIWDNQKERFFIRQSELLKKLSEANEKSEKIKDIKDSIKEMKAYISDKCWIHWYWPCNNDWDIMNEDELKEVLNDLEEEYKVLTHF